MSKTTFNVGVIGYGLSAKVFHIPLIQATPELNLYGIVQRTPKPNNDSSTSHPGIKSWRSVDELFADKNVDICIVTSTPEAHYTHTRSALESGKHVVLEKPMVPSSAEARDLISIAQRMGKLLTVYQNRRWDQDFLTLQEILAKKEDLLGDIAEFETHYDRFRPSLPAPELRTWKNEDLPAGGALFDLGSHLLDQVYCLFGAPERVTGFVGVQKRGVTGCPPDACTVLLDYGDGKPFVTVKSSSISPEEEQLRFWVRGTKGSFKKFYLDVQEAQLVAGGKMTDKGFGHEPESHYGEFFFLSFCSCLLAFFVTEGY